MIPRRRSILIATALAFTFVGGERLYSNWRRSTPKTQPISAIAKAQPPFADYFKAPRLGKSDALLTKEQAQAEAIDPACLDFMAEAQRMNMEMFTFPPKLLPLPRPSGCAALPESLAQLGKHYEQACGRFIGHEGEQSPATENQWLSESMGCQAALWQLRGGITAWRNRGKSLAQISDMNELSDHLAFAFSQTFSGLTQGKPDGRELVQVSERILELNPHVFTAAKTAALGSLMEAFNDKAQWNNPAYLDRMQWLLDRAEHINPAGSDLAALREVVDTRGLDPQHTLDWAQAQLKDDPSNARAVALLGYAQWRLGQRQQALANLRRAAEMAPENQEVQANWQAAQQPGATADSVKLSLTVGMNLGSALQ